MEQFLYYLLRASVLMALFYGFYKLFFGKNTFHHINRITLILMVMLVAVLPVFRFNLLPEKKAEPVITETLPVDFSAIPVVEISELPAPQLEIPWTELLSAVFAIGCVFAFARYLLGLRQLITIIRKSEKQTLDDDSVLCVTHCDISPFSWMKFIVLSRKDVSADNRAIINHERAHIHLQHSFDMIFLDLFTCVFWFNPFSWLLRREVQSVHEYQADEQVLNNGIDAKQYQLLLIRKSVGEHKFALANNFRQRNLHKRMTMMMKNKTNKQMKWKYTVALPVLFLAMVALSVPKLNAKAVEKETSLEEKVPELQNQDSVMVSTGEVDLSTNPLELGETEIVSKKSLEDEKLTLSGLVKGKDGLMPGVGIVIKDNNAGTITDPEGGFVIKAEKGDVLRFMMVGYKTFEYKVEKAESNLVIVLQPDDVAAVDAGKIEDIEVNTGSSQQHRLVVRGTDVLKGKPLLVLDGKPIENLDNVNPDNIESVDVLKNASATAMYGDKGKDGMVLITTKYPTHFSVTGIQGKVIGVDSRTKESTLSLRGISEDKKPLIIVDGEKKGKDFELNSISPSDIESMSVFKDPAAADLYGDEGKNGVIQIMTKQNLKSKVSIDNSEGVHISVSTFKTGEVIPMGDFKNTEIYINGKKSTVEQVKKLHEKDITTMGAAGADLDFESDLHKKYNVHKNKSVIEIK